MSRMLRFQLYDDPSRNTYSQLHPDIPVDEPPPIGYGHPVRVGDDADDPATWPSYRVAHIAHLKQEPNPDQPDKNRIVYEFFLAREEQWPAFQPPKQWRGLRDEPALEGLSPDESEIL